MTEQLTPAASISPIRLSTADPQLFPCNSLIFTLLSKTAPANHLVSHSCKNKGLKVPCFHTLTKKGVGEGVRFRLSTVDCQPCAVPESFQFHEPPITSHRSFFVSPSASTLTRKLHLKSSRINTYKKQGRGRGSSA